MVVERGGMIQAQVLFEYGLAVLAGCIGQDIATVRGDIERAVRQDPPHNTSPFGEICARLFTITRNPNQEQDIRDRAHVAFQSLVNPPPDLGTLRDGPNDLPSHL